MLLACAGAEEVVAGAELVTFAEFDGTLTLAEDETELELVEPPIVTVVLPVRGMETLMVVPPMSLLVVFALFVGMLRLAEDDPEDTELVDEVVGESVTGALCVCTTLVPFSVQVVVYVVN